MFASDIIGYLFGYAHLTNTRSLALVDDPEANAYELLFSFPSNCLFALMRETSAPTEFKQV